MFKKNLLEKQGFAIGAICLIAAATIALSAPAAHAAGTYVDGERVPENALRSSGPHASVRGGTAEVVLGGGSTTTIQTYRAYPGYAVLNSSTANSNVTNTLNHVAQRNALSGCFWSWLNVGGGAEMTCTWR